MDRSSQPRARVAAVFYHQGHVDDMPAEKFVKGRSMMTMLERVIAAAANAVGADPQDLRGLATGATLR